ncbi:cilia- and flagella-associated protein 53 [Hippoglossus stenolepis]|uniref:cilia- and flagella-associated protein 53 n=1 Tax=Hippoglossus stenolepis TaxID=195615 RepID=UPI001FB0357D|nr:cilia- and flagella-associated protein 53 [Hippoglossus stenolepis]
MFLSQRRTGTPEVTGPTPHTVAVRAKLPQWRRADELMMDRRRQDAARDQLLKFNRKQQNCDIKSSWLKSSERQFLSGTVNREVQAAVKLYETDIEHRRHRLQVVLAEEEQQLLQELEETKETLEERQEKMRVRAQTLRERRERERQQLVSDKLDQQFREQCQEVRSIHSRQREQQVREEQTALVRSRQQQLQQQQEEDELFHELWEADRRAKEEQEQQRAEMQRQRNMEQLNGLDTQVEEAELKRRTEKEQREEEARLMRREAEEQVLQGQQQQRQKLQTRLSRRHELDQDFRMKMKHRARDQQDELQLDMNILQLLLQQETDEKQKAARRKVELCEEQHRYREYLSEELQRQRREDDETEQLINEKMEENWNRKEEQNRLQQENRRCIINEVVEAQRLQIQRNIDLKEQKRAGDCRERDELNRMMEEMKVKDEEERRSDRRRCEEYELGLRRQLNDRQQLQSELRAQSQKEEEQSATLRQIYNNRKLQVLATPISHTAVTHPFRGAGTSGPPPQTIINLTRSQICFQSDRRLQSPST